MGVMLSVKDLVVNYGAINAIKGISFDVNAVSYTHLTLPTKLEV